jgi:hypothetical protein
MIIFLQCRSMVKEELSIGREEQIIKSIKLKLADHLCDTEGFFVKMKTMTMLSILLLRFHGILMTVEERNTVLKTIEIKKKKMAQVDNKDDRLGEFECLLYLILELYKILFLLKLDQQMILRFYNQLHAYAQIFIEKKPFKQLCLSLLGATTGRMKERLDHSPIHQHLRTNFTLNWN